MGEEPGRKAGTISSSLQMICEAVSGPGRVRPECSAPWCDRQAKNFSLAEPVCNLHYLRVVKVGSYDLPDRSNLPWHTCTINGCSKKSRTRYGKHCEMHYYRRYINGSFDRDPPKYRRANSTGYITLSRPGHPLASKLHTVFEHRFVLYEKIGPGRHNCHWCGLDIEWVRGRNSRGAIVADHLDGDKESNDPENLVPACHPCNSKRGLFMSWVMDHLNDPFLIDMFDAVRQKGLAA